MISVYHNMRGIKLIRDWHNVRFHSFTFIEPLASAAVQTGARRYVDISGDHMEMLI